MTVHGKVLVVDDDPIQCELIQAVLHSVGMEVDALTDSVQAATRLEEVKFDAVFLEAHMPPPDGIALAQRMRASRTNRTSPIVMMAGDQDRALQMRAFQAGVNFFLYKPVNRQRLLRLLRVTDAVIQLEKRRFERVKVRCKVMIESDEGQVQGTTLNLSMNGLLVKARQLFPMDSLVRVRLELSPAAPPLHAVARVTNRVGHDRMGLELENLGPAESQRLQKFILPLLLAVISEEPARGTAD